MKKNSRIRFNPFTKEVEVEGSELFVKQHFNKLQAMIVGSPEKTVAIKEKEIKIKAVPKKKVGKKVKIAKATPAKKVKKVQQTKTGEKKVTNTNRVIEFIQSSREGIPIAELRIKTGLTAQQIAYIINRAAKKGKIRRMNRGIWSGGSVNQVQKVE